MGDRPYTDDDLRTEAARQMLLSVEDPDFMGIGERMEWTPIPSRPDDRWDDLDREDFDKAQRAINDLLGKAADVSEWAINLGADGLTQTITHGWHVTGTGWDLAVQIAHRPHAKPELIDEIESAVRLAVERVLGEHGLKPRGLDTTS